MASDTAALPNPLLLKWFTITRTLPPFGVRTRYSAQSRLNSGPPPEPSSFTWLRMSVTWWPERAMMPTSMPRSSLPSMSMIWSKPPTGPGATGTKSRPNRVRAGRSSASTTAITSGASSLTTRAVLCRHGSDASSVCSSRNPTQSARPVARTSSVPFVRCTNFDRFWRRITNRFSSALSSPSARSPSTIRPLIAGV